MIENIKIVRQRTDYPVMECKKALEASGNDVEKAVKYLKTLNLSIPEPTRVGGMIIHLINRPPYVIQDSRRGIDNTRLLHGKKI